MHLDPDALFEHEVQVHVDRLDRDRGEPERPRSGADPTA
jgi:hypothetical protein